MTSPAEKTPSPRPARWPWAIPAVLGLTVLLAGGWATALGTRLGHAVDRIDRRSELEYEDRARSDALRAELVADGRLDAVLAQLRAEAARGEGPPFQRGRAFYHESDDGMIATSCVVLLEEAEADEVSLAAEAAFRWTWSDEYVARRRVRARVGPGGFEVLARTDAPR